MNMWAAAVAAVALGLGQAASIAWPLAFGFSQGDPLWWLQLITLALLVHLLAGCQRARHAGALAWLWASAWLVGSVWWLFISMHRYADLPAATAALAVLALSMGLALYYAVAGVLFWRWRTARWACNAALFAALWAAAEMARGTWLSGFGWAGSGYAHVAGPLAVLAPLGGVYGIAMLGAGLAAQAALAWRARRFGGLLASLGLVGALALLPHGAHWSQPAGSFSATLLQGNIAQEEKFQPSTGIVQALTWYGQQLIEAQTDLVVAPETALPVLPQQLPEDYWETLQAHFGAGPRAALLGVPLGSYTQGYTNAVVGLGASVPWQYHKAHLVPFGEFIPPLFKWFTRMMNIPLGDFNRGALAQPPFVWQGQRLAPTICYEDLFGEELALRFQDAPTAPTVLVNVSNIAWFGDSIAIAQHAQISRMRTLEFERPMLRATNTGATLAMDHTGHTTQALPSHQQGALIVPVVLGRQGITPYAWWAARFGLWPLWGLVVATIVVACYVGATRARNQKTA